MATLIAPDGGLSPLMPANGRTFTLAEVQAAVGGYIEIHPLAGDRFMVLNEDGKRLELAPNPLAEAILFACGKAILFACGNPMGDWVVGPALCCSYRELEGEGDDEAPDTDDPLAPLDPKGVQ